jgi:hypothetical protein
MNGLDSLKKRLALVTQAYTMKKDIVTERRKNLEETLLILDDAINDAAKEIQDTQFQIQKKEEKIHELQNLSIQLKKKIQEHRSIILAYVSNIYSESSMLIDENGDMDIMKHMILSEEDTDFFLSDLTYKTLLTELGQKFVNDYRLLVKQYYINTITIEDGIRHLTGLKQKLVIRIENISIQKSEREKLLEVTKGEEKKFEEYISAQIEAENTLSVAWKIAEMNYNDGLEKILKKSGCDTISLKNSLEDQEKCVNIRLYFDAEKQLRQTEYSTGTVNIFTWPVP